MGASLNSYRWWDFEKREKGNIGDGILKKEREKETECDLLLVANGGVVIELDLFSSDL